MTLQSIKKLLMVTLIITSFMACNNGPSLQTYFVDNELKPGFTSFDIPASIINIDNVQLNEQQRKAYKSVNKLNVLAYKLDGSNIEAYNAELAKVKSILSDTKYDELIRGGNTTDGKFMVKFLGEVDKIDELIILGNTNEKGFMVARVLGNNMNAKDLMSLQSVMKDIDFEDNQLTELTNFFK